MYYYSLDPPSTRHPEFSPPSSLHLTSLSLAGGRGRQGPSAWASGPGGGEAATLDGPAGQRPYPWMEGGRGKSVLTSWTTGETRPGSPGPKGAGSPGLSSSPGHPNENTETLPHSHRAPGRQGGALKIREEGAKTVRPHHHQNPLKDTRAYLANILLILKKSLSESK